MLHRTTLLRTATLGVLLVACTPFASKESDAEENGKELRSRGEPVAPAPPPAPHVTGPTGDAGGAGTRFIADGTGTFGNWVCTAEGPNETYCVCPAANNCQDVIACVKGQTCMIECAVGSHCAVQCDPIEMHGVLCNAGATCTVTSCHCEGDGLCDL